MAKNHPEQNDGNETSGVRVISLQGPLPSEIEAEARIHQEGYESFRWYDVPGTSYPMHRHGHDECIWVLKGEMTFKVGETEYPLQAGDRIYLPARMAHTVLVPAKAGVTYLVGEKI